MKQRLVELAWGVLVVAAVWAVCWFARGCSENYYRMADSRIKAGYSYYQNSWVAPAKEPPHGDD